MVCKGLIQLIFDHAFFPPSPTLFELVQITIHPVNLTASNPTTSNNQKQVFHATKQDVQELVNSPQTVSLVSVTLGAY